MDTLADEVGISSSAVWKILLHRSVAPLMDGRGFDAIDFFGTHDQERTLEVKEPKRQGLPAGTAQMPDAMSRSAAFRTRPRHD